MQRMRSVAGHLASLGCKVVDVTGGEPLLRKGWDGLCAHIVRLGMRVALVTNGTLLTEEALSRARDAGVQSVAVSLDGTRQIHDATRVRAAPGPSAFDLAVEAISRSVEVMDTVVITQVNVHNIGILSTMRRMLRRMGVRRWQLQLCVPTGRLLDTSAAYVIAPGQLEALTTFIADAAGDQDLPRIDASDTIGYYTEREIPVRRRTTGQGFWVGCTAGVRAVAITYEGKVRGCSAMPAQFDAGDLHEEDLTEIWADEKRFAYSTLFDPGLLEGGCAGCRYGHLCRAGCTTMAWWTTGSIYDNPYCLYRVRRERS